MMVETPQSLIGIDLRRESRGVRPRKPGGTVNQQRRPDHVVRGPLPLQPQRKAVGDGETARPAFGQDQRHRQRQAGRPESDSLSCRSRTLGGRSHDRCQFEFRSRGGGGPGTDEGKPGKRPENHRHERNAQCGDPGPRRSEGHVLSLLHRPGTVSERDESDVPSPGGSCLFSQHRDACANHPVVAPTSGARGHVSLHGGSRCDAESTITEFGIRLEKPSAVEFQHGQDAPARE